MTRFAVCAGPELLKLTSADKVNVSEESHE